MLDSLLLLTVLAPAGANAAEPTGQAQPVRAYAIPAGSLEVGLQRLAAQSGEQVVFDPRRVSGLRARPVAGRLTAEAALSHLLAGSGLTARRTARGVWVVGVAASEASPAWTEPDPVELEEVIVTGALLPGRGAPSPLVVLTRDHLRAHTSVADALQALPQNFGASGNEAALQNGADPSGVNVSFATGVNLRGLGSAATLVLVNGRRLAGAGVKADFTDISMIPAIAVDRIEILLDGASAVYGSDAVAGVVNIILKTDHDGSEARLQAGSVLEGSMRTWGLGQLSGRRWSTGGLVLAYEQQHRGALPAAERTLAGDADLRRLGGRDHRAIYSDPGNLVDHDPRTGVLVPTHAIRFGVDGSVAFLAGERNLGDPRDGLNVLGHQVRRSLFASFRQAAAPTLEVTGRLLVGRRAWITVAPHDATIFSIDSRNPGFASPTGASSHQLAYDFGKILGSPRVSGDTSMVSVAVGADLRRVHWRTRAEFSHATIRSDGRTTGQLNTAHLHEAVGTLPDNPETGFRAFTDGHFNPFSPSQPASVRSFLGEGWTRSAHEASMTSVHLQMDGAPIDLPAGALRLAAGFELRRAAQAEHAEAFTSTFFPTLAVRRGRQSTAALFAEADIPLWRARPDDDGGRGLRMSLAVRHEGHEGIDPATTPRIGFHWTSGGGLAARAVYGASFRAPTLSDLGETPLNAPSLLPRGQGAVPTLVRYGGNPRLEPETAISRTAGIEWSPSGSPSFQFALNWFETRIDQQIGRPAYDNILAALDDPSLRPFVEFLSPATNPADRRRLQSILDDPVTVGGQQFPVEAYGAIVDARYLNTGALEVEGVDLQGRYAVRLGSGDLRVFGAVTRLSRYDVQATPAGPRVSRLDRPNFPLAVRGRFGLDWSDASWGAGLAIHYAGGYRDLEGRRIRAWATSDLHLRRRLSGSGGDDLAVSLTLENLFDADPPFYDAPQGLAYDAANADVLGRRVSIQLTRVW